MTTKFIENTDRALIGIDKFHYAKLEKDTPAELTYGDMVEFQNTIELSVTTNAEVASLYADNKPAIVYTTMGNIELAMTKTVIPNEVLAEWLGSPMEGGVRHITSAQNSPYYGVAWRQLYSDGKYAYVKLYKGKFTEPDKTATTKEESIEFQTAEITAQFAATTHEVKGEVDGKERSFPLLMSIAEEDSPSYTDEGSTWFDAMYVKKP